MTENLLSPPTTLIAAYDLCTQPVSFGDVYMFQYAAYTIAKSRDIKKIDFYIYFDKGLQPADQNFCAYLEPDKYYNRALKLLPIFEICPYLGSLSILDSSDKLNQILRSYVQPVEFWPTVDQLNNRVYTYYEIISIVDRYREQYGAIPDIPLRSPQKLWVENVFQTVARSQPFVTVNIRKNDAIHPHRNSALNEWKKFFEYCRKRYPVTFVVLCDYNEIDADLRKFDNVVYAKDLGSTADMDCSLVINSAFHMGSSSGPCAVAFLSKNPFFVSNIDCLHRLAAFNGKMQVGSDGYLRTPFNSELQRHINGKENFEILVREFELIWNSKDWSHWKPCFCEID